MLSALALLEQLLVQSRPLTDDDFSPNRAPVQSLAHDTDFFPFL